MGRFINAYGRLLCTTVFSVGISFCLGACGTTPDQQNNEPVNLLADTDMSSVMAVRSVTFDENSIIPDVNQVQKAAMSAHNDEPKGCRFSSMQRKNTLGYEIDPSRHLTFTASPSFDIWDPTDFKAKFSVRFTKALGGDALKRPCTFGSGYYGLLPYLRYNPEMFSVITDPTTIKSMLKEKAEEKRLRQLEADQKEL